MLLDIQGDMNAIKDTMNELEKLSDEEKAEEYVKTKHSHIMSETMKSIYKKIYLDGLAEGKKEICKICEKKMIEGNPNMGCAYRQLGNEYCWEFAE